MNIKGPGSIPLLPANRVIDRKFLSADTSVAALKQALNELAKSAPADHDVVIEAFDITVIKARYIEPHTLVFEGTDNRGLPTATVFHFSQLIANIVCRPMRGNTPIITGFKNDAAND